MTLSVCHISTYAGVSGGAARAATSLHRALVHAGVSSFMLVGRSDLSDEQVRSVSGSKFTCSRIADRLLWRLQYPAEQTWRSPARFTALTAKDINALPVDIVNLHWITDGLLSIEEIGKIQKPLVWSMYDMWPFCGSEHYVSSQGARRWIAGYSPSNRNEADRGFDLDRWAYQRKAKHWSDLAGDAVMIPASTWLQASLGESALMSTWESIQIPHVVEVPVAAQISRSTARDHLDLPRDVPILLFLSSAGIGDARKGWHLLIEALLLVKTHAPSLQVVVVGPAPSLDEQARIGSELKLKVIWRGIVQGDEPLHALYRAANVTAVPSREDTMPLTAMEAQSAGCPVVGFDVGGLRDIVQSGRTGYLARAYDTADLGHGILAALEMGPEAAALSRDFSQRFWSPQAVASQYTDAYMRVLDS